MSAASTCIAPPLGVGDTTAFLQWTHEHAIDAGLPGYVVVSRRNPPEVRARYTSQSYRLSQLDEAAAACHRISDAGHNAYVRVHLLERSLDRSSERGSGTDTRWVTHLAADVDISGPGHASTNLPDATAAVELIDATLPPSAIISSGGGLYPVWRLAEPLEVRHDDDRQRVKSIGRRLDAALAGHGWHVDPTVVDLARIIRPAGVTNHKPDREPRPVTVLRGDACGSGDWTLDEIDAALPPAPEPEVVTPRPARLASGKSSAPWDVLVELYDDDTILAADPVDRWERVDDQYDGKTRVAAWRRVGSSADYSIKAGSDGALIVWSSSLAARLGIDPGGGVSRWQLLCHFAGVDPRRAGRWAA